MKPHSMAGLLGLTLLVAGCGGGGGDNTTKPAGSPAPGTVPDKSPAAVQAIARDDLAHANALLANESLRAYSIASDGFTNGATGACSSLDDPDGPFGPLPGTLVGAGSFSITYTDAAGQPVLTRRALANGDHLSITLVHCRIGAGGAIRNGTVTHVVGDAASRLGVTTFDGGFSFADPTLATTLTFAGSGAVFSIDLSDAGNAFQGVTARAVSLSNAAGAAWRLEVAEAVASGTVLRSYRMSGTDVEVAIRQTGDGNASPTIDGAAADPAGGVRINAGTFVREDVAPTVDGTLN